MHIIKKIINGSSGFDQIGVYSVCSASDFVIEAALRRAKETNTIALIEATANQVNQFGGYTGMRPLDFMKKVYDIADAVRISHSQIVLGGDHLGPYPWRNENEDAAMQKAIDLIVEFVGAGFTKIHIDTSMRLGSDSVHDKLSDEVIARRAATLAQAAASAKLDGCEYVFVLGSEVPIPGGAQAEAGEVLADADSQREGSGTDNETRAHVVESSTSIAVTSPEEFRRTYECFLSTFHQNGLSEIWDDVIAFVVQPGVEFGEMNINQYSREEARKLCGALDNYPGICFEGHSTDYQPQSKLGEMIADGIKILKVGPALTFYQREALYALEMIEKELLDIDASEYSCFASTLDKAMLADPADWVHYYHGDERRLKRMRQFSLSDRCRYYLSNAEVASSIMRLIQNLDSVEIPYSVLSQFMPIQAELVNSGRILPAARELILSRITNCIDEYLAAIEK